MLSRCSGGAPDVRPPRRTAAPPTRWSHAPAGLRRARAPGARWAGRRSPWRSPPGSMGRAGAPPWARSPPAPAPACGAGRPAAWARDQAAGRAPAGTHAGCPPPGCRPGVPGAPARPAPPGKVRAPLCSVQRLQPGLYVWCEAARPAQCLLCAWGGCACQAARAGGRLCHARSLHVERSHLPTHHYQAARAAGRLLIRCQACAWRVLRVQDSTQRAAGTSACMRTLAFWPACSTAQGSVS